ncbi:TPA: hypothetical protein ACJ509_003793 [Stenotrophomonas maltophilia]
MDMQQRQVTRPVGLPILRAGTCNGRSAMTRDPTIHVEWLDAFLIWAENHGIATRCRPTEKPAGTLDIDTEHVVSNITYWSSGECDAAILDVSSGQSVYQRSWSDLQPADFDTAFAPWLAIVRGHST